MTEAQTVFYTRNENIGGWPQPIAGLSKEFNQTGRPAMQLGHQIGEASVKQLGAIADAALRTQSINSLLLAFEGVVPPLNDAEYVEYEVGFYKGAGLEREA